MPDAAPAAGKGVPDPPPPPARKLVTHGAALCAKAYADGDGLTDGVVESDTCASTETKNRAATNKSTAGTETTERGIINLERDGMAAGTAAVVCVRGVQKLNKLTGFQKKNKKIKK